MLLCLETLFARVLEKMNQVILEATAHALSKSLRGQLKSLHEDICKRCYGCQIDHPSQKEHECLDYSTKRMSIITEAVQLVDEKIAITDLYWNISVILTTKHMNIRASDAFMFLSARPHAIDLSFMKQDNIWCSNLIAMLDNIT